MKFVPAVERFWIKVQKTEGCWEWTGARVSGYGVLGMNGTSVKAHRFSWELHNGPIPKGLHVCHHCDNRKCIRPDHLFLGTDADNIADAVSKGRMARGSRQALSKLTPDEVKQVRALLAEGRTARDIASRFGVFHTTIQAIKEGKSWGWL